VERKRDEELKSYLGTNCPHIEILAETGKKRKTLAEPEKRRNSHIRDKKPECNIKNSIICD